MGNDGKSSAIAEFSLWKGLAIATFSGVMSSCFSFGFQFGGPISEISKTHGTGPLWVGLPVIVVTHDFVDAAALANRVGVSLRTLQGDFSVLGTTVNSLIRMRRLYYARDQLSLVRNGTDTTIAEVAYNSGFNDISYFNRCFKKIFSCSPKTIVRGENSSVQAE